MSEVKERSGIFKFFYVLLSIITFPIFAVLFLLRHPLWVLFVLMLIAGGMAYWPMSKHNVALTDVIDWYKDKYQTTKLDLAKKAIAEGKAGYVPKVVLDEMKKIEEDAKEAALPKGENYNAKVERDKKSEELKANLKQRGGFKKKGAAEALQNNEIKSKESANPDNDADVLTPASGGLSALLPVSKEKEVKAETEAPRANVESKAKAEPNSEPEVDFDLGVDDNTATLPEADVAPSAPQQPLADDENDDLDLF